MCITAFGANLSATRIVVGELSDETRYIIYKNDVAPAVGVRSVTESKPGWRSYTNMMFWPLPAVFDTIEPVEATNLGSALDDIDEAVTPTSRSVVGSRSVGGPAPGRNKVIETEFYTLVLAENPTSIPSVLETNCMSLAGPSGAGYESVLSVFSRVYKSMPVAMMLFKNEAAAAGAVLIKYQSLPQFKDFYFVPTLDGHGELDLEGWVDTDHMIAIQTSAGKGDRVIYKNLSSVNPEARPFLPERVIGGKLSEELPNGDFWFRRDAALKGVLKGVRMVLGEPSEDGLRWCLTFSGVRPQGVDASEEPQGF